jgi:plastocyanin
MRHSVCLLASAAMVTLAEAATLRVDVGLGGLKFTPNSTAAAVGDIVEFHFHPQNHSVVQSSFDSPCNFGTVANPIFSGFMPVSSGEGVSVYLHSIFLGFFNDSF